MESSEFAPVELFENRATDGKEGHPQSGDYPFGGVLQIGLDSQELVPGHPLPDVQHLVDYRREELGGGNRLPEGKPLLVGLSPVSVDQLLDPGGLPKEHVQKVSAGKLRFVG